MHIPFHKTHTTDAEIKGVIDAINSGWLTMGPKTLEFEEKFRAFVGSQYAISTNSGTAALHLSLKAIGLKENDEVIIPTTTFVATAEVVTYFNAKPVLVDVEYDTHNIDAAKIEEKITKKTKAIIPVHFGGQPCDMDEIYDIAQRHNLYVIDDAAHAIPSYYKGKIIGSLSDITCFSFYATKPLSTGEGGMVTTNNGEFTKKIKINRLHGISKDAWDRYTANGNWYYEVVDNGNKYNTTDINSALGIAQLSKQEWMRDKRSQIAEIYSSELMNLQIELPVIKKDRVTSWHLYVIKVNNRNQLIEKLRAEGIGTSVHFIPVHKHPYYKETYHYNNDHYPIANRVFEKSISLPIYPDLAQDEIEYIIEKIKKHM